MNTICWSVEFLALELWSNLSTFLLHRFAFHLHPWIRWLLTLFIVELRRSFTEVLFHWAQDLVVRISPAKSYFSFVCRLWDSTPIFVENVNWAAPSNQSLRQPNHRFSEFSIRSGTTRRYLLQINSEIVLRIGCLAADCIERVSSTFKGLIELFENIRFPNIPQDACKALEVFFCRFKTLT